MNRYRTAYVLYPAVLLTATAVLAAALILAADMPSLSAFLVALNIAVLVVFGWDKGVAGSRLPRVPESVLLGAAALGATPAVLAGQTLFRHKTVKFTFRLWLWLVVLVQIVLATYLIGALRSYSFNTFLFFDFLS